MQVEPVLLQCGWKPCKNKTEGLTVASLKDRWIFVVVWIRQIFLDYGILQFIYKAFELQSPGDWYTTKYFFQSHSFFHFFLKQTTFFFLSVVRLHNLDVQKLENRKQIFKSLIPLFCEYVWSQNLIIWSHFSNNTL